MMLTIDEILESLRHTSSLCRRKVGADNEQIKEIHLRLEADISRLEGHNVDLVVHECEIQKLALALAEKLRTRTV